MLAVLAGSVVLVSGGIFFYFRQFIIGPSVLAPQQNRLSQNETITLLTKRSSLTFSLPISSSSVALESLPDYAKYLIFPGAISISIEKASFQNSQQGFIVSYKKAGNILDIYRAFTTLSFDDWKVVYGSRTNDIAFVDMAGNSVKIRITLISNDQNIDVNITAINL